RVGTVTDGHVDGAAVIAQSRGAIHDVGGNGTGIRRRGGSGLCGDEGGCAVSGDAGDSAGIAGKSGAGRGGAVDAKAEINITGRIGSDRRIDVDAAVKGRGIGLVGGGAVEGDL